MAVNLPFDWRVAEDAIVSWFTTATELTTIWRGQNAPQPAHPYGSLLVISGPIRIGGADEIREETDLSKVSDAKITPTAANSTTYTVQINASSFPYLSDSDATVAEITAGLKATIDAGSEPVTTTDNGTDLDVEHTTPGELFDLTLSDDGPGNLLDYANNDLGHEMALTAAGQRELVVSCQTHVAASDVANPDAHAQALLSAAQSALGLPTVLASLRAAGLAVVSEGPISDLGELVEDSRNGRANMDIRFRIASNLTERTGYLERTAISSDIEGAASSLQLDDEIIGA